MSGFVRNVKNAASNAAAAPGNGIRHAFNIDEDKAQILVARIDTFLDTIETEIKRLSAYHDEGLVLPPLVIKKFNITKSYTSAQRLVLADQKTKALKSVRDEAGELAGTVKKTVSDFILVWNVVDDQRLKSRFIISVVKDQAAGGTNAVKGLDVEYLGEAASALEVAVALLDKTKSNDSEEAAKQFMAVYARYRPVIERYRDEMVAPPLVSDTDNAIKRDPGGLEAQMKKLFSFRLEQKMADMQMTAWANGVDVTALSPAVATAVTEYTTGAYTDINGTLLGLPGKRSPQREAECKALAGIVANGLAQLETFETWPVTRGESAWNGSQQQYTEGNRFKLKAFWSTGVGFKFDGPIQISVRGKARSAGKDVAPFSKFPNEMEVLFPPGTEFVVLSNIPGEGGRMDITVQEV